MIYDKKLKPAKIIDFLVNEYGEKLKIDNGTITLEDDVCVYENDIIGDLKTCINDMTHDLATQKLSEYEYDMLKLSRDTAKAKLEDLLEFANRKYKVKRFVRAKHGIYFDLRKCKWKKVYDGLVINGKKYTFYELVSDGNSLYNISQTGDKFLLKDGTTIIPKVGYCYNKRKLYYGRYQTLKPRKILKNLNLKRDE